MSFWAVAGGVMSQFFDSYASTQNSGGQGPASGEKRPWYEQLGSILGGLFGAQAGNNRRPGYTVPLDAFSSFFSVYQIQNGYYVLDASGRPRLSVVSILGWVAGIGTLTSYFLGFPIKSLKRK